MYGFYNLLSLTCFLTASFSVQIIAFCEGSTDTGGMRGRAGRLSLCSAHVRSAESGSGLASSSRPNSSASLMASSRGLSILT